MSDESKSWQATTGCMVLMAIPAIFAWDAYVLTLMWSWFMVPTFGLAAISGPTALGLIMVAAGLRGFGSNVTSHDNSSSGNIKWIANQVLLPAICLLVAYVAKELR